MTSEHENSDLALTCCVCANTFIFSQGEQRFFRERELSQPRRCASCRAARREERELSGMKASKP